VVDAVAYRWPRSAGLLKARPKLLIEDGKLNQRVMRREFMTIEELSSRVCMGFATSGWSIGPTSSRTG
jgi:uncharacterized membrane protein YcaP (DUF421 family)